jgi:hypothetical protein
MSTDTIKAHIEGHLRITEKETGKILFDGHNDINAENMSYAIALALCSKKDGFIKYMAFGNGGARATSSNKYIYSVPQTVGRAASLYNEIYEIRKDLLPGDEENYMTVTHATGNEYTDIMVRATMKKEELNGALGSVGNNNSIVSDQTFSEIGLLSGDESLLTHLCFSPVTKTDRSELIFDYLLRINIV